MAHAHAQLGDCTCPIQSLYSLKGPLSPVAGAQECQAYSCRDSASTCEARHMCENDASCRGFSFSKGDSIERVVRRTSAFFAQMYT